jgi:hypothetical protein
MDQQDLICTQCPLADCDEESLFCCFRWATDPNDAQKAVQTNGVRPYYTRRQSVKPETIARREYFKERYLIKKRAEMRNECTT